MSKIGLFSREISPLLSMSVQSIQLSELVVIWDCEHLSDKWVILAALLLQEWLQNCDLISFLLFFLFILKNKNAYIFTLTIWSLAGRWAMNIFSDLGNSQISKCFCLSFFFFFPQHSLSLACCPIYILQNHHANHYLPYHSEVLSIQSKQFKQMKKRAGSTFTVLGEKKKNGLWEEKCVSVQQLRTVIHTDRGRELNLQRKTFTKLTLEP